MNRPGLKYLAPVVVWALILFLSSAVADIPGGLIRPAGWPEPVYTLTGERMNEAGFTLGKRLFYDASLSGDGKVSCGSCHRQKDGFAHGGVALDTGVAGRHAKRNTPSLVNLAWNKSFQWDGGVNNLELQPLAPITDPVEMNTTLNEVVRKLNASPSYKGLFYLTFGDSVVTGQRVLKAFARFTMALESFNSKYDRYTRHESGVAFTKQELHGLSLFRERCASCHSEPLFTDYSYQYTGLLPDPIINDAGRYRITRIEADSLKFKVPSLRNVAVSAPYMHDGRYQTLAGVMDHYGADCNGPMVSPALRRLRLSGIDKQDLVAFLNTLTDSVSLNDPKLRE